MSSSDVHDELVEQTDFHSPEAHLGGWEGASVGELRLTPLSVRLLAQAHSQGDLKFGSSIRPTRTRRSLVLRVRAGFQRLRHASRYYYQ